VDPVAEQAGPGRTELRILIVEDEPAIADGLTVALASDGHAVDVVVADHGPGIASSDLDLRFALARVH
jgi:CheY-like chemotaxis protein